MQNRLLKESIQRNGLTLIPGCFDPLELGVRTIIGQQISVKAATTVMARIAQRFGEKRPHAEDSQEQKVTHFFPAAETLATANQASFTELAFQAKELKPSFPLQV